MHPASSLLADYFRQGLEYYNPAFCDWMRAEDFESDRFDRTKYPRMPWHDVHSAVRVRAAASVTFIHYRLVTGYRSYRTQGASAHARVVCKHALFRAASLYLFVFAA